MWGAKKNKHKALSIAEKALIVVYDKHKSIPLPKQKEIGVVKLSKERVIEIMEISDGIGPNYATAYADFLTEMRKSNLLINQYAYNDLKMPSIIIAVSENHPLPGKNIDMKEQHKRLKVLRKKHPYSIIINVALRDPYDAFLVKPYVDVYVTTSGSNISNVKAIVSLLSGEVKEATGKLSVTPLPLIE